MKRIKIAVVFVVCLSWSLTAYAQQNIVRGLITSADREPLISVTITEIDKTNRIVNGTVSNYDGEYVLQVRDRANKLRFNYVGFKSQDQEIGERGLINVTLQEESLELSEAVVTGRAVTNTGTMNVPTREISFAMQKVDAKEFEGIQVTSVEDALQGRVSGLDIVSNSGAPGSGMSMRIRGTTSLRSDGSQPLIVVNGVPYETTVASDFDFATAREEQYAELLTVNPDDILEIVVLKDAASTAIWGAQGANGVLQITTKKGARGKPRVQYSYRLTSAFMPDPIPLLNGDEYTMLMKEEYLNPSLNTNQGNIPEYSYVQDGSAFFWNYNNNTDWVKEITRAAWKHDNNLSISGGGERGDYRISFGYLDEQGIVYGQGLRRFTNRTDLGYVLSDRLIFRT
ncbi:MAG: TonB-dependent receptor plug domain-containing protein, partial [Bacteroidales bacterium]|nr:TonB-dependent receptor plug domain-containing protein [Bacteroidales bacterium]